MPGVVSERPGNLWPPDPLTGSNRRRIFLEVHSGLTANIEKLIAGYQKDQVALDVLGDCELEIDYFRRFSNHYCCLFVIAAVSS